jgi:hypothetical protein
MMIDERWSFSGAPFFPFRLWQKPKGSAIHAACNASMRESDREERAEI